MYLSRLILNPRCRQVRRELHSPYELHRTLLRAFPDEEAGGPGRVLFRLEPLRRHPQPVLLVQSEKEPDWHRARNIWPPDYLAPDTADRKALECKPYNPTFATGQRLYFRLRANPTVKRAGQRLGLLTEQEQAHWLARKGEQGGFQPVSVLIVPEGMVKCRKTSAPDGPVLTHYAVTFEGTLRVTDPDRFVETIRQGVGSGKAFGFGLLSVASPAAM